MAKTISEGFRKLRENLEITGLQESTVSTRQTNVRTALEDDFDVKDSFLTGSYRRSTMIAPLLFPGRLCREVSGVPGRHL